MLAHRAVIQQAFSAAHIPLRKAPDIKNQPRLIGSLPSGMIQGEIIGWPRSVRKVTVRGVIPNDRPDLAAATGAAMGAVAARALPGVDVARMVPDLMQKLKLPENQFSQKPTDQELWAVDEVTWAEVRMNVPHIANIHVHSGGGWLTLTIESIG